MQASRQGDRTTAKRCYLCSKPIFRGDKRVSLPRLALVVHRACYEFDVTRGAGPEPSGDDGRNAAA
jgi:hypothetical protein